MATEIAPETAVKSQEKTQAKSQRKPQAKPQTKLQTKAKARSKPKAKRKPGPKPKPKAKSKPEKKEKPTPFNPELTDAGNPRIGKCGASIGWRKNTQNSDIRDAMAARGIGQALLGRILGMGTANVNRMLKRELADNIRECILESIKRYDPVTNPHGI